MAITLVEIRVGRLATEVKNGVTISMVDGKRIPFDYHQTFVSVGTSVKQAVGWWAKSHQELAKMVKENKPENRVFFRIREMYQEMSQDELKEYIREDSDRCDDFYGDYSELGLTDYRSYPEDAYREIFGQEKYTDEVIFKIWESGKPEPRHATVEWIKREAMKGYIKELRQEGFQYRIFNDWERWMAEGYSSERAMFDDYYPSRPIEL